MPREHKPVEITEIRIVLDNTIQQYGRTVDRPIYWGVTKGEKDIRLHFETAHQLMRSGTPFTVALADPDDKRGHYEASQYSTMMRV